MDTTTLLVRKILLDSLVGGMANGQSLKSISYEKVDDMSELAESVLSAKEAARDSQATEMISKVMTELDLLFIESIDLEFGKFREDVSNLVDDFNDDNVEQASKSIDMLLSSVVEASRFAYQAKEDLIEALDEIHWPKLAVRTEELAHKLDVIVDLLTSLRVVLSYTKGNVKECQSIL